MLPKMRLLPHDMPHLHGSSADLARNRPRQGRLPGAVGAYDQQDDGPTLAVMDVSPSHEGILGRMARLLGHSTFALGRAPRGLGLSDAQDQNLHGAHRKQHLDRSARL